MEICLHPEPASKNSAECIVNLVFLECQAKTSWEKWVVGEHVS